MDQRIVKTLFQTNDFFNFITQAKPDKSASKIIVKFKPQLQLCPKWDCDGTGRPAHKVQISD